MNISNVEYRDLTFDLKTHPINKSPITISGNEVIKSSIKNLVMMKSFDKPFHPEINGGVFNLLFEPMTDVTTNLLMENIKSVINQNEPRVRLIDVLVEPYYDQNLYQISIVYTLLNQVETQELGIVLEVLR